MKVYLVGTSIASPIAPGDAMLVASLAQDITLYAGNRFRARAVVAPIAAAAGLTLSGLFVSVATAAADLWREPLYSSQTQLTIPTAAGIPAAGQLEFETNDVLAAGLLQQGTEASLDVTFAVTNTTAGNIDLTFDYAVWWERQQL